MIDKEYNWPLSLGDAQFLLDYLDTGFPGYVRDHVEKCDLPYIDWFLTLRNRLWNIIYGEEVK